MGTEDETSDPIPEFVSSQPSNDRRKLFRKLAALAGLGITSVLLSRDQTGLLPKVEATSVTGTGVVNHVPYWDTTSDILSTNLIYDSTNNILSAGSLAAGFAVISTTTSSTTGIGLEGFAIQTTGTPIGVLGVTENQTVTGVMAGVYGLANTGTGVLGQSASGAGVKGVSSTNTGVLGDGGILGVGVLGTSNGNGTAGVGVLARSGVNAKALVVQGGSSQGLNLQEWQKSDNTVLGGVIGSASGTAPQGAIFAPQLGQNSPNVKYTSPGNPGSFTNAMNASGSAMQADGLAISFTPKLTGNVLVTAAVDLFSTNPSFGTFAAVWYGTGTAPSFGATLPSGGHLVLPYRGSGYNPTALFPVYIPGLTVGTQYWFDLGHAVNAGGNGSHFNIAYTIIEI